MRVWAIESPSGLTDYGVGVDDVVFEWKESHPEDEAALGKAPACERFNGAGTAPGAAGAQCAQLTVDRTVLYECDEAVRVDIYDFSFETPERAQVQVALVGRHLRILRFWEIETYRLDTWQLLDGRWVLTPERL